MKTLALSGWGQPHDALAAILPDATHLDYAHHESAEAAIKAIVAAGKSHAHIVGWSLGGQLAARAVSQGLLRPEKLTLIGVPFQFVANEKLKIGMPRDVYKTFCDNYVSHPERTLRKAWELIAYGDEKEPHVRARLAEQNREKELERGWQRWLQQLDNFNCEGLIWENFPPTLLIHGDKDAVVWHEQAQHFGKYMPQSRLETLRGCGHAPHWHDTRKIRELIERHV